ncbi:hypothetical protein [Spirillospora sp. CA-294931]|uniref:hypothetical protein n=1 Tax=Spirillospora sp. CA-294931 TaxID=3240042 RepID=UPI003D8D9E10
MIPKDHAYSAEVNGVFNVIHDGDRGATAMQYAATVGVVSVALVAVLASGVRNVAGGEVESAVCDLFRGTGCDSQTAIRPASTDVNGWRPDDGSGRATGGRAAGEPTRVDCQRRQQAVGPIESDHGRGSGRWGPPYQIDYEGGERVIPNVVMERTRSRNRLWTAQCTEYYGNRPPRQVTRYWLQFVQEVQLYNCPQPTVLGFPVNTDFGDCTADGDPFLRLAADNPLYEGRREGRPQVYCESDATGFPYCLSGPGGDRSFLPMPT